MKKEGSTSQHAGDALASLEGRWRSVLRGGWSVFVRVVGKGAEQIDRGPVWRPVYYAC